MGHQGARAGPDHVRGLASIVSEFKVGRRDSNQRANLCVLYDGGARRRATHDKGNPPKDQRHDDPQGDHLVIVRLSLPAALGRPRCKGDW